MSIIKVLNIKYVRENTRASFSDWPALLLFILQKGLFVWHSKSASQKQLFSYITDRVERIVGSTSNSSELNDSGDQAADSQRQEAEETIPESSILDTDGKGHESLRKKLCAMA